MHYGETWRRTTDMIKLAAGGNIAKKRKQQKAKKKSGRGLEGKELNSDTPARQQRTPTQLNWARPLQSALLFSSRSLCNLTISLSRVLMVSCDFSIDATRVFPSRFHRCTRSSSALRRRCLVSIFSQRRHCIAAYSVKFTSFMPHVSPVRYS